MKFRAGMMLVVAVFVMVGVASGEEPYPYPPGEKQVVFGFSGWQVGAYEGGLGIRLFHSGRLASLLMLELSMDIRSSESEYDSTSSALDESGVGFGASYMLEKYLPSFHSVAPYFGIGVGYSYSWSEDEYEYYRAASEETVKDLLKTTRHRATLQGVLGAEWAFTSGISLGARYYLRLARNWTKSEKEYFDDRGWTTNVDAWSLRTGAGYLTASLRF